MPGPCKGYTTPHRCATVNESKRHQASDRDQQARCKLQEKTLDFHANFHGPVYLSIEPEAKRYKYNIFDPDKPHLYMLGSNCKVAPFIKGAAPTCNCKLECPFIKGAAPTVKVLSCSIYKWSNLLHL